MKLDIETARNQLAKQASAMCEKGGLSPMEVASLYLEAAVAVAVDSMPQDDVSAMLWDTAARIDALSDHERYDS